MIEAGFLDGEMGRWGDGKFVIWGLMRQGIIDGINGFLKFILELIIFIRKKIPWNISF